MEWLWQELKIRFQGINEENVRYFFLNLHPIILVIWIFINLTIPAYGIILYNWQYAYYHPIFWIFIPDSNSFAILYGLFLLITLGFKKNVQVLNMITFIGLIKVFFGYITVFTLLPSFFDLISLSAHTFELIEGLIIIPFLKVDIKNYSVSSFILGLDWFFDFFNPFDYPTLALYPKDEINPYNTEPYILIFFSVFTIVIFSLLIYIRLRRWKHNAENVKWVEKIN